MRRAAELMVLAAAQPKPIGQVEWTVAGTYQWPVPDNVYSISAVTVGGAGSGGRAQTSASARAGSGPGLRYITDAPVTPGEMLTVIIGAGGPARAQGGTLTPGTGGDTRIQRNGVDILWAQGGQPAAGGTGMAIGGKIGGGDGGLGGVATNSTSNNAGAGGAGGYAGNGGAGTSTTNGLAGSGGAGSGGGTVTSSTNGGLGGGVGIRGQGASGAAAANGNAGSAETGPVVGAASGSSTGVNGAIPTVAGRPGGARIIYGEGRSYPSIRTADE